MVIKNPPLAQPIHSSLPEVSDQSQLLLHSKRGVDMLSKNLTAYPQGSKLWLISLWTFIQISTFQILTFQYYPFGKESYQRGHEPLNAPSMCKLSVNCSHCSTSSFSLGYSLGKEFRQKIAVIKHINGERQQKVQNG